MWAMAVSLCLVAAVIWECSGTARNDDKSHDAMKSFEEVMAGSIKGQLELGGFSKNQMASLLSSYLGAAELEPAIVDFLYSKSTGNPFVATEYLRAVVEQGLRAGTRSAD